MAFGDLKTVTFDHNIVSPYNEFKTGMPLRTEFVGNRWKTEDVEKALPDLGNETMQEAFHKIGDRMSNCSTWLISWFPAALIRFDRSKGTSSNTTPMERDLRSGESIPTRFPSR